MTFLNKHLVEFEIGFGERLISEETARNLKIIFCHDIVKNIENVMWVKVISLILINTFLNFFHAKQPHRLRSGFLSFESVFQNAKGNSLKHN
jgi:hypothetical protein